MPFNIRQFKAVFDEFGYIQTNNYEVSIPLPRILTGKRIQTGMVETPFENIARLMVTRIDRASIPGVNLATSDVFRYGVGVSEKKPYNAQFMDLNLQFICDKYSLIWHFFHKWIQSIYDFAGDEGNFPKFTFNYKDDYISNVYLTVYNKHQKKPITINCESAFPTAVTDSPLSWSDRSNLVRVNVNMTYRAWWPTDTLIQNLTTEERSQLAASGFYTTVGR